MKNSALIVLAAMSCIPALALALASLPAARPPRPIIANIDTTQVGRPISPY